MVKLSVVSCPPVVEVVIRRPHVKYSLGFSVQNGVVSMLPLCLSVGMPYVVLSLTTGVCCCSPVSSSDVSPCSCPCP